MTSLREVPFPFDSKLKPPTMPKPKLEAKYITSNEITAKMAMEIFFKEKAILYLVGSEEGISARAVNTTQLSADGFNWSFEENKGRIKTARLEPLLSLSEVRSDSGSTTLSLNFIGARAYSFLVTQSGYARGGHSHPYPVDVYQPAGTSKWYLDNRVSETVVIQNAGDKPLRIEAGVVHWAIAMEDSFFRVVRPPGQKIVSVPDLRASYRVREINQEQDALTK